MAGWPLLFIEGDPGAEADVSDNDGAVGFFIGALCAVLLCIFLGSFVLQGTLDDRCATVCAPLVGKDQEDGCACATATGWASVTDVRCGKEE